MSLIEMLQNNMTSVATLVGLLIILIGIVWAGKVKISTYTMATVALLIAVAIILKMIKLYHMPQGGSVTLGSMLPILLINYRYGPRIGLLAGFMFGLINIILDPFIVHPLQVLLDYPLPYMCLAIAAFRIRSSYIPSIILAVALRCVCHVISGVVFFANYAPVGESPLLYSLIFNATYLIPDTVICIVLLKLLPLSRLLDAMKE